MESVSRKSRICAISALLTQNPSDLYSLSQFAEMFGAAKSTLSEDVAIVKEAFKRFELGEIEVVMGAAGGVRFVPRLNSANRQQIVAEIRAKLEEPSRILPGGFIYTADVLLAPRYVDKMAQIMWGWFAKTNPDFIITVEAKGIPLAMAVARLFGKPLIVVRKENKITEGPVVTLNYLSGSSKRLSTLSLSKRAVHEGQRALVIDDFLAGGGTVRAVFEMMKEFSITVVGCGVAISTQQPERKKVESFKSIFILEEANEEEERIRITTNTAVE